MAKLQLQITYTSDGNIQVVGDLNNKGLCYAALELAKEAVREYHASQGAGGVKLEGLGLIDTGKQS